jgi:aspartate aminotransferase-like enzyme
LLKFVQCSKGKTIIYTGSGTGAMGAVIENYVTSKKKAFVINGGSFGHRWFQLCEYYKVPAFNYIVPFAKDINYIDLEQKIVFEKPDVLLCQHHETSTGQLFNLEKISKICHKYGVSLVVDIISSFLAEKINMDLLDIDICVTSSQKGLNIPPGLSILFLSEKLNDFNFNHCGFYWDFDDNLNNMKRGQTPFSPATSIHLQLNQKLKILDSEGGIQKNIEMVQHRANVFRQLCKKYNWTIPAENPSNAITGFQTKEKSHQHIFHELMSHFNTFIMPGSIPGFYRVSHMGLQTDKELQDLAERIHKFEME